MKTTKTMQSIDHTIKNIDSETLKNPGFYKEIYPNNLTSKNIGQKVYFTHSHGISCRIISKLSDTHFTHSSIDCSSTAEVLISYFKVVPMYIDTSRDKLFDTTVSIILDNNIGNKKPESVMRFFSNRDLVLYTSGLLE